MNDKIIINITKNPTNFCEENRSYKAKWNYHYNTEFENVACSRHGGYNLNDLYNKLENTLEYYEAREKELEIVVKSEVNKDSLKDSKVIHDKDLELIRVQLFKTFNHVHLDF